MKVFMNKNILKLELVSHKYNGYLYLFKVDTFTSFLDMSFDETEGSGDSDCDDEDDCYSPRQF